MATNWSQLHEVRFEDLRASLPREREDLLNPLHDRLAWLENGQWRNNLRQAERLYLALLISSLPWMVAFPSAAEQFQVNSHTTETQWDPAVAMAPGGTFVVVWDSRATDHDGTDNSRSSIRGQRFEVDGSPDGNEFQVNTDTMGYQISPAVDQNDDGFVAIWLSPRSGAEDVESITTDLEVRGQRFLANGMPIGNEFRARATDTENPQDPIVRVAPDGSYLIAWSELNAGGRAVQGQLFSPTGVGSMPFLISQGDDNNTSIARRPAATHLGSPETTLESAWVVVWQCSECNDSDSHGQEIRGQKFAADGSKMDDAFPVNSRAEGDQVTPSVAPGDEGSFFVVWATEGSRPQIWGRLFAPSGVPLANDFLIADAATSKPQVGTLYDSDGTPNRFVVVWWNKLAGGPGDPDLFHRYFAMDGTPLGEPIRLNDLDGATEFAPALSTSLGSTFVTAWHSIGSVGSDDSSSSIQAQRLGTLDVQVSVDDGETSVAATVSELGYTISVVNLGEPLTDAHLVDTFPEVLTCSWLSQASGDATGNTDMGSGHLDETLDLPTGSSVSYQLTCAIAPQAAGRLISRATLTADNSATTGVDNDTVLDTNADLQIVKEDGVECVVPGRRLGYEIVAYNAGPTDSPETTITDDLPDTLQDCSWECEHSDGPCDNPEGAGDISETLSMPVGRQITYRIGCNVSHDIAPTVTTFSNTAQITSPGEDPFPGNNQNEHVTEIVTANADLELFFTGTDNPIPGRSYCFLIAATNRSGDLANPARLRYTIPDGLSCAWATTATGDDQGNRSCGTTRPTPCQVPTDPSSDPFEACADPALADDLILPEDTNAVYALECQVDPDLVGTITHNISIESDVRDCDPEDNVAEVPVSLVPEADLYVQLEVHPLTAVPGDGTPVQYDLTVGNHGPSTAVGARLIDNFPEALSCSWESEASEAGVAGHTDGAGDLDELLRLPPDSSVHYDVTCTLDPAATMALENTATVTLPANIDEDPNGTNNSASVTTDLTPGADLEITLTDGIQAVAEGQHFTYTIQVTNHGPSSVSGAQVQDHFPPVLSCSWTCSGNSDALCTSGPVVGNIEDSVDLSAGSSATYSALCEVLPITAPVVNEASVTIPSGIEEIDPSNNMAADTNGPPIPFPFIERFSSEESLDPIWVRGDSAELVSGALQLTQPLPDQQGWAIIDAPFASFRDILVEFDYSTPEGSQGMSVFLFDGVRLASDTLGGSGPCLGYSTGPLCAATTGVSDAYVGVGLDVQGDFSEPGTGSGEGPGSQPNHIVVRGSGDGAEGYPFLTSVEVPNDIVGQKKMRLWFVDRALTVEIEGNGISQTLLHRFDLMSTGGVAPLPEVLKIGFAATTTATASSPFQIDNLIISVPEITPGESVSQTTDTMSSARSRHSLTPLLNGKILALGSNNLETELFDPATGRWTPTGSLATAVSEGHSATLLATGQVLAVGGASAQIYDPATDTWSLTASLSYPRTYHSATLLTSGRVLVAGGHAPNNPSAAVGMVEIFDPFNPGAPSWTDLDLLMELRHHHTATLQQDGTVWIAGGEIEVGSETLVRTTVESVDPDGIPPVTLIADLPHGFTRHSATRFDAERILLAGGRSDESCLLSASAPTCYDVGLLAQPLSRTEQRAVLFPSGDVFLAGGFEAPEFNTASTRADIFHPSNDLSQSSWDLATLSTSRAGHAMTLLPSGAALLSGGRLTVDGASLGSSEIYRPGRGHWETEANFDTDQSRWQGHTSTLLPTGEVLVVGGQASPDGELRSAALYESITQVWTTLDNSVTFRERHTATLLTAASVDDISGRVLIVGGEGADGTQSSTAIFDAVNRAWSTSCQLPEARSQHTATLLADGRILVVGGGNAGGLLDEALLFDPGTSTDSGTPMCNVTATTLPHSPRIGHTATLLPSGHVLVVGGYDEAGSVVTMSEIYDPVTDRWNPTASPGDPRSLHTASLLPSGRVLVAGGFLQSGGLGVGTERFDPATETWSQGGPMSTGRAGHTATLLPSGQVLVTGGEQESVGRPQSSEIYDPATDAWRIAGRLPYLVLSDHTATLLASGDVLMLSLDAQRYDPLDVPANRVRPEIIQAPLDWLRYDQSFSLAARGLTGVSEAADGIAGSSNGYPMVQLQSLENDRQAWLIPNPRHHFDIDNPADDPQTTTLTFGDETGDLPSYYDLPSVFDPGWHRLTIVTAGVPSDSALVHLQCSLEVGVPEIVGLINAAGETIEDLGVPVPVGGQVRFAIETRGGRQVQWQKNTGNSNHPQWVDIEEANGDSYLTPPLSGLDSGTQYRVRVSSGCTEEFSQEVTFFIEDQDAPSVRVVSPDGGEYWALSTAQETNLERVIFEVTDPTTWPCELTAELIYSLDEGESWQVAPTTGLGPDGVLPRTLGDGGRCELETAVDIGSISYVVPLEGDPPSGEPGSLYKIRLTATDHGGNVSTAESTHPFFIVPPNDQSVRTLILFHPDRLGVSCGDTSEPEVCRKLRELADHPQVNGLLVDLSLGDNTTPLKQLYQAWDDDTANQLAANAVLFDDGGIQDRLLDLVRIFTNVNSVLLVGDDTVIPFARIPDRSGLLGEAAYTEGTDLSANGSTVGQAIEDGRLLTDDPLGSLLAPIGDPSGLDQEGLLVIPDVAMGRLVETPEDIVAAIANFQRTNGLLDLSQRQRKVLVTGYDFLTDSANIVAEKWRCALDPQDNPSDCAPPEEAVNANLLGQEFGTEILKATLCGDDGRPYGLISLNGHASHFLEGVPGEEHYDITGLKTEVLDDDLACGGQPLDLQGAVIYAVGCHGGLPVPDNDPETEHLLDLPQTFLRRGALTYVANSGYGWGLRDGVGYSERLIEIFTDQLRVSPEDGQDLNIGQAVLDAKLRYYQESRGLDAYGLKTLMQWVTFGFPMARLRTGVEPPEELTAASPPARPIRGPAPSVDELSEVESLGPLTAERQFSGQGVAHGEGDGLPPFLTRSEVRFRFSNEAYTKRQADGTRVPPEIEGCPSELGCYYTLNGLGERGTGDTDRPIQPFFVYDSRLSGTSQHGVLWLGGQYREETGWLPVFAELISNGADTGSNHGSAPQLIFVDPIETPTGRRGQDESCRVSDFEANTMVVPTGDTLVSGDVGVGGPVEPSDYDIQRVYEVIDVELFYFNNPNNPTENCDRQGPGNLQPGEGPFDGRYHETNGSTLSWQIPVTDDAGVWRVVVVYDIRSATEVQDGEWQHLELTYDATLGAWTGEQTFSHGQQVTYVIQAVDNRGNVSWLRHQQANTTNLGAAENSSGVDPRHPETVPVSMNGTVDLAVSMVATPNPVDVAESLQLEIQVELLDAGPATSVRVEIETLPGSQVVTTDADWNCNVSGNFIVCDGPNFALGVLESDEVVVQLTSPSTPGVGRVQTSVISAELDLEQVNNHAEVLVTVVEEDVPPRVLDITSAARVEEGALEDGAVVDVALTQLRVAFSEPVIEADDSDNFLLVEAGPDGMFQTNSLALGPAGDDLVISLGEMTYESETHTTVLGMAQRSPLPDGEHLLLVGRGIYDTSFQFLDGDGDGAEGGDFRRIWTVRHRHLVLNPNFDRSLSGWAAVEGPAGNIEHDTVDAEGVPSSGSLSIEHLGGIISATYSAGQCIPVEPGDRLAFGGRLMLGPEGVWQTLQLDAEIWSTETCEGLLLDQASQTLPLEGVDGGPPSWEILPLGFIDVPANGHSLLLSLTAVTEANSGQAVVRLDNVEVYSIFFADGFETGDTSGWSNSVGGSP